MGKKEYLKPLMCFISVSSDVIRTSVNDGVEGFDSNWLKWEGENE